DLRLVEGLLRLDKLLLHFLGLLEQGLHVHSARVHGLLLVALVVLGVALSLVSVSVTAHTGEVPCRWSRDRRKSPPPRYRAARTRGLSVTERGNDPPEKALCQRDGRRVALTSLSVVLVSGGTQPTCHGGQSTC